jgi:ribosomal protein S18 acetylase RimI-like enzyme
MVSENIDPRRLGTIWSMDLAGLAVPVQARIPAVYRRAGPPDFTALAEAMDVDPAEVARRFETGRRCTTAWVDGRLAAYGWVSYEQEYIGELRLRLRLQPGEAYIWDCATRPALRGNHLYSALLAVILADLRGESLQRAWIGTDVENEPSQHGIARAGFLHVADLVISRVLGMRLVWVQGLPGMPADLVADARRVFLDNRDQVWLSAPSMAAKG